jgi:hypothetical protein
MLKMLTGTASRLRFAQHQQSQSAEPEIHLVAPRLLWVLRRQFFFIDKEAPIGILGKCNCGGTIPLLSQITIIGYSFRLFNPVVNLP